MDVIALFAGGLVGILVLGLGQWFWPTPHTVRHHERALLIHKGAIQREVGPGRYWLRKGLGEVERVDCRRRQVLVQGQEVLTEDRVAIKVSMVAEFTVADVARALTGIDDYQTALYSRLQLALREVVAGRDLDTVLAERGAIGQAVALLAAEAVSVFGLELHEVRVRDFMLAAGLRNAYSDVFEAKQRGLAALERARGESAALRSLANLSDQLEKNPALMQLRWLHAIEAGAKGQIVVSLGSDSGSSSPGPVASTP